MHTNTHTHKHSYTWNQIIMIKHFKVNQISVLDNPSGVFMPLNKGNQVIIIKYFHINQISALNNPWWIGMSLKIIYTKPKEWGT